MSGGLSVPFTSNAQLNEIEVKREKKRADESSTEDHGVDTGLGSYIRRQWERNRRAKHEINYRLLMCLRARKGEYSIVEMQKILAYGAADPVYLKLTGTKSRAASSWIRDILLPASDTEKPWRIHPGPIPDLPDDLRQAIMQEHLPQAMQSLAMQGITLKEDEMFEFRQKIEDQVLHKMTEVATTACKNAELKIEDKFAKGEWKTALNEFIEDFVTYPFAVIKGPYYQKKRILKWVNGKPTPEDETHLCYRRVSPFDIFYSPYARNIQEGNLIERLRYTQETLFDLIGVPGYREEHIRSVLELHKYGNLRDWIWEDFERDYLENNSPYFLSDRDTIDGLHFWGYVKGQDLITWGYKGKDVKDEMAMYPVDAILVGKHVIRCEINNNPMHWRPYHSACWDKVPGSLVGVSLPEQMEDHQRIVNATCRSLMQNLALSSGPQAMVLTDMLAEGENITNIFPGKIWQMRSSMTGNSGKPVEFFQPEINSVELMNVLNAFEQKTDDVTNVPRYSYGNEKIGGAGSTATGLSMLMNSAAKGIRRAIASIDSEIIQPVVMQTFTDIMQNDPDPNIKGDIRVVADGSAAILIKEQLQQNQKDFLQLTSNPVDMQILGMKGRARLLKDIAQEMGLDPLLMPTDQELDAQDQQAQQQQQQMHEAQVADLKGQGQGGDGGQVQAQVQQAMQQIQDQEHQLQISEAQLKQQAMALKQEEAQQAMKDALTKKQAQAVDAEMKRMKAMKQALDDQMAELVRQQTAAELERDRTLAKIEKAHIDLEIAGDKLKGVTEKVKMVQSNKEDEMGKTGEGESAKANQPAVDGAIKQALTTIAEAMKLQAGPKQITVQRDGEGKISGATAKPSTGGLQAE
jgi:hypothetical protein